MTYRTVILSLEENCLPPLGEKTSIFNFKSHTYLIGKNSEAYGFLKLKVLVSISKKIIKIAD
jgi:hypothetical protein